MHTSPHIIRVNKPGRMRWVGHVACTGRRETYTDFWWGNTEVKRPLGRSKCRLHDTVNPFKSKLFL